MIRKFTKELAEIFVKQNISITDALCLMMKKSTRGGGFLTGNKVKKTAEYLFNELESGNFLSNAFKSCPFILFDDVFVSFIAIAEKNGDLKSALEFLNKKYERRYLNKSKLLEISFYPFFVIILAIIFSCFLFKFSNQGNPRELVHYVFLLILICCGVFWGIFRIISEDKLYEAFLSIDFLVKAKVDISSAVKNAACIVGESSRLGKSFLEAGEKLEFGMSLEKSFSFADKYQEAFYYADYLGDEGDIFGNLAVWINSKSEKRRRICLNLVEPLFIAITGGFLLLLIMNFFMPYMNNFDFL